MADIKTPTVGYDDSSAYVDTKDGANHTVKEVIPAPQDAEADVWGDLDGKGPNYRGLGWIRTVVVMCKIQIGLGVLAMPSNLATFGMGPGLAVIFFVGILATWAGWVVGMFKLNHPGVHTLADVGRIMVGPRFGDALMMTFVGGAQMLAAATAFNALSLHGTCTIVFVFVAAFIAILVGSIQTLGTIGWITWVGMSGIMAAVITMTIAVGVQERPSLAPQTGPWSTGVVTVGSGSFIDCAAALSSIVFTYSGPPNFVPVVAEMRDPKLYTRSLLVCQAIVITTFLVVSGVVYHFCGIYVASPALGSAGPLLKRVCYGVALPGLLVGAVLFVHLPAKYLFVRILGKTDHLTRPTKTHYLVWFGCIAFNGIISFLVAEAIPVFNDLLSLIGAALATPLCMTIQGAMFIFEERRLKKRMTPARLALHAFNGFTIIVSFFVIVAGWYASVMQIKASVQGGGTTQPFSCADNSNSV